MNSDAERSIERLIEGNRRYHMKEEYAPHEQEHRDDLADNGQRPYACVIGCSDSRAVPETVFHARLGDIFSIRTAGNVVGDAEIASAEYAAEHLHVPLIVVMGHTHCGAVDAALNGCHGSGYMEFLLNYVRSTFEGRTDPRECERLNALAGVDRLMESDVLNDMVLKGELEITAAIYDIRTGKIEFLKRVRSQHTEFAGDLVDGGLPVRTDPHACDGPGLHLGASGIGHETGDDALGLGQSLEQEEVLLGGHLEGDDLLSAGVPFRELGGLLPVGLEGAGYGGVGHLCGRLALGHLDVRAD